MTASAPRVLLEICVDSPEGLATAVAAGADRVELCSSLDLGGLTPSPGLIALAAAAPVPVYAMIRPRVGDFSFSPPEIDAMRAEIAAVRAAGLAGVVLGASRPDRSLDAALLARLCEEAAGLGRTLHRAFDLVPDPFAALDLAIELGFERILTSGGAPNALAGAEVLAALRQRAAGRISIMPGSGVRPETVAEILRRTGAHEIHASARAAAPTAPDLARWGFAPEQIFATSAAAIALLRESIETAENSLPRS
ncbi:copper homeostasis protein CutC [Aureimonas endophytica]|uniref:PF03932 family protein CutC n=1 Tax=Aureimonas endophytica TaxID=2027858 RepID=A0A917E449_9HYPH|nr:copper homeostasis protein CutC [Aureimonas endophytica]GGD99293.1 copper homeostasis protein CutC [Aureimonas endophytica]